MFPELNSLVVNLILSILLTVLESQSYTQCPTDFPQVILNHTKHFLGWVKEMRTDGMWSNHLRLDSVNPSWPSWSPLLKWPEEASIVSNFMVLGSLELIPYFSIFSYCRIFINRNNMRLLHNKWPLGNKWKNTRKES